MEEIGREYIYDPACYKYGARPRANSTKYYFTEYVAYKDGIPYFIQKWDSGNETTDSEPQTAKGKELFPNLTQKCPGCGQKLNLTHELCSYQYCFRPIDNPIVLDDPTRKPAERILETLFKNCQELKPGLHWKGRVEEEISHREKAIIDLCEILYDICLDQETKLSWSAKVRQMVQEANDCGARNANYLLDRLYRRRFQIKEKKKEKENG